MNTPRKLLLVNKVTLEVNTKKLFLKTLTAIFSISLSMTPVFKMDYLWFELRYLHEIKGKIICKVMRFRPKQKNTQG